MSIKDTITAAHEDNLRKNDSRKRIVTAAMLTALSEAETSGKTRKTLSDTEAVTVLRKLSASRKDAAAEYVRHNAPPERAVTELEEADYIDSLLPPLLDDQATRELVTEVITTLGLTPPFQGRYIGAVRHVLNARSDLDMNLVTQYVREHFDSSLATG